MTSALRPRGSTTQWRKLRAWYAQLLPCVCHRCGLVIRIDDAWDLDHVIARAHGGTDDQLAPAHRLCNRRAGAAIANTQRATRTTTTIRTATTRTTAERKGRFSLANSATNIQRTVSIFCPTTDDYGGPNGEPW